MRLAAAARSPQLACALASESAVMLQAPSHQSLSLCGQFNSTAGWCDSQLQAHVQRELCLKTHALECWRTFFSQKLFSHLCALSRLSCTTVADKQVLAASSSPPLDWSGSVPLLHPPSYQAFTHVYSSSHHLQHGITVKQLSS